MSFASNLLPKSESLEITNTSVDRTIDITYAVDVEDRFRFTGGSFPGTGGTCDGDLAPLESCNISIEFSALIDGTYADNLLISYAYSDDVANITTDTIALSGVKTTLPMVLTPSDEVEVVLETLTGDSILNLGAHILGLLQHSTVVVKNTGTVDADINLSLPGLASFSFRGGVFPGVGGTCGPQLLAGASCIVTISSNLVLLPGLYTENLVLNFGPAGLGVVKQDSLSLVILRLLL